LGVTENLLFGNNFSVLGWIYPDFTTVATDKQTIFQKKTSDSSILIDCSVSAGNINCSVKWPSGITKTVTSTIDSEKWVQYHFVNNSSSNKLLLYIDGESKDEEDSPNE